MAKIINKPNFRNELAKKYFEEMSSNTAVYECGTDNKGNIYFAWLNGNISRCSRRAFISEAKEVYSE